MHLHAVGLPDGKTRVWRFYGLKKIINWHWQKYDSMMSMVPKKSGTFKMGALQKLRSATQLLNKRSWTTGEGRVIENMLGWV